MDPIPFRNVASRFESLIYHTVPGFTLHVSVIQRKHMINDFEGGSRPSGEGECGPGELLVQFPLPPKVNISSHFWMKVVICSHLRMKVVI